MEAKGKHGEGWENGTQMTRMKQMYADFFVFQKNYYFCHKIHHLKFQLICPVILTLKMI